MLLLLLQIISWLNRYAMFTDGKPRWLQGTKCSRAMINCYACQEENDTFLIGSNWKHHWKLLKHCYNVQLVPTGNSTGKYYNTGGDHDFPQQCQALLSHNGRQGNCKLIRPGFGPPPKGRSRTFFQRITTSSITFR
jgi:hypothetical protein